MDEVVLPPDDPEPGRRHAGWLWLVGGAALLAARGPAAIRVARGAASPGRGPGGLTAAPAPARAGAPYRGGR